VLLIPWPSAAREGLARLALPGWKGKEFHVVVRSGLEGLGAWHDEQRNLYEDYLAYMGEPLGRIVRVWLIANSVFQRRRGRCSYGGIRLSDGKGVVEVCQGGTNGKAEAQAYKYSIVELWGCPPQPL
jgi:hypothetical protein